MKRFAIGQMVVFTEDLHGLIFRGATARVSNFHNQYPDIVMVSQITNPDGRSPTANEWWTTEDKLALRFVTRRERQIRNYIDKELHHGKV